MLKRISGKKLGRSKTALKALFRSQVRSLVDTGAITTTLAKAKAVQPYVEKVAAKLKSATLAQRRQVVAELANDRKTVDELIKRLASQSRASGFTKIIKLPRRLGDNAQIARLEWVEKMVVEEKAKEKGKKAKKEKVKTEKETKEKVKKEKNQK